MDDRDNTYSWLTLYLDGPLLRLTFRRRESLRVDLNDPASLNEIERFLDGLPACAPGCGVPPIRLRDSAEALL